ncbi:MAG: hypothetical protein ABI811_03835 [Acidobacteriota bacterium]
MGDDNELVKNGIEAVMKPIAELIEKLAGPAAEEIGFTLQDSVRAYRAKRQLKLFQKMGRAIKEAGFSAKPSSSQDLSTRGGRSVGGGR